MELHVFLSSFLHGKAVEMAVVNNCKGLKLSKQMQISYLGKVGLGPELKTN